MCSPVICKSCGKTTWAGCGLHVDAVKASVPASQWCTCERKALGAGGFLARVLGGR